MTSLAINLHLTKMRASHTFLKSDCDSIHRSMGESPCGRQYDVQGVPTGQTIGSISDRHTDCCRRCSWRRIVRGVRTRRWIRLPTLTPALNILPPCLLWKEVDGLRRRSFCLGIRIYPRSDECVWWPVGTESAFRNPAFNIYLNRINMYLLYVFMYITCGYMIHPTWLGWSISRAIATFTVFREK